MWLEAVWIGYPMRLELICIGLLDEFANHYTTQRTHEIYEVSEDDVGPSAWQALDVFER